LKEGRDILGRLDLDRLKTAVAFLRPTVTGPRPLDADATPEQYRFAYFNRANDAMRFAFWQDAAPAPDQEMVEWADVVIEKWTELRGKLAAALQPAPVVEVEPEPVEEVESVEVVAAVEKPKPNSREAVATRRAANDAKQWASVAKMKAEREAVAEAKCHEIWREIVDVLVVEPEPVVVEPVAKCPMADCEGGNRWETVDGVRQDLGPCGVCHPEAYAAEVVEVSAPTVIKPKGNKRSKHGAVTRLTVEQYEAAKRAEAETPKERADRRRAAKEAQMRAAA
jgi:hypothetical protein